MWPFGDPIGGLADELFGPRGGAAVHNARTATGLLMGPLGGLPSLGTTGPLTPAMRPLAERASSLTPQEILGGLASAGPPAVAPMGSMIGKAVADRIGPSQSGFIGPAMGAAGDLAKAIPSAPPTGIDKARTDAAEFLRPPGISSLGAMAGAAAQPPAAPGISSLGEMAGASQPQGLGFLGRVAGGIGQSPVTPPNAAANAYSSASDFLSGAAGKALGMAFPAPSPPSAPGAVAAMPPNRAAEAWSSAKGLLQDAAGAIGNLAAAGPGAPPAAPAAPVGPAGGSSAFTPRFVPQGQNITTPMWAATPEQEQIANQRAAYANAASMILGAGNPNNPLAGPSPAEMALVSRLAGQFGTAATIPDEQAFRAGQMGADRANRMDLQKLENQGRADVAGMMAQSSRIGDLDKMEANIVAAADKGMIPPDVARQRIEAINAQRAGTSAGPGLGLLPASGGGDLGGLRSLFGETDPATGRFSPKPPTGEAFTQLIDKIGADKLPQIAAAVRSGQFGDPTEVRNAALNSLAQNYLMSQGRLPSIKGGVPGTYTIPYGPDNKPLMSLVATPPSNLADEARRKLGAASSGVPYDTIMLPDGTKIPFDQSGLRGLSNMAATLGYNQQQADPARARLSRLAALTQLLQSTQPPR